MKEIEINQIRSLTGTIKENYGYDFSEYALSSFKRRVNRVMEIYKMDSIEELMEHIANDRNHFGEFLSEITVNVTEMFRDPSFWQLMRSEILPLLFKKKDQLRFWHAGCSSGEEVFSMSIILKEENLFDKVTTIASDIDDKILARAKEGQYHVKNMETNAKNYATSEGRADFKEYYSVKDNYAKIDPSLLSNVTFKDHNLAGGSALSEFDLIFCRNVLIYFNQTLQNKVLTVLHKSLAMGGILVVGSKESLIWCDAINKFELINSEEKIYRKIKE